MLAAGRSCLLPQVHPVHVMLLAVMYPTSIQHLPLVAQASLQALLCDVWSAHHSDLQFIPLHTVYYTRA